MLSLQALCASLHAGYSSFSSEVKFVSVLFKHRNQALIVQGVAAACDAVPECDFLVYYPRGRSPGADPADRPSGVLKTARAPGNASHVQPGAGELLQPRDYDARYALNPLAVSYFKCALPVVLRFFCQLCSHWPYPKPCQLAGNPVLVRAACDAALCGQGRLPL